MVSVEAPAAAMAAMASDASQRAPADFSPLALPVLSLLLLAAAAVASPAAVASAAAASVGPELKVTTSPLLGLSGVPAAVVDVEDDEDDGFGPVADEN